MADGLFYNDTRAPHMVADLSAVTLATTDKALYPAANFPILGSNYFWVGKKIKIRLFGKITTGTTPGNGTWDVYWGTGADANGTILASSAALTLLASQTNLSWFAEFTIHCRALGSGSAGSLFAWGQGYFNTAVVAAGDWIAPTSAAAAVGVDTTAANIISVQFKRSGSTAETMTVQDLDAVAMN